MMLQDQNAVSQPLAAMLTKTGFAVMSLFGNMGMVTNSLSPSLPPAFALNPMLSTCEK